MNAMTVAQRMTADEYLAWDGPRGTNLVVEIRSPSPWRYDVGAKKTAYERHGLPELWLVDTAASEILVFRRSTPQAAVYDVSLELAAGDTLASPLLPGFALPVADIFPTR
jgi:Uma2 family endonuclease